MANNLDGVELLTAELVESVLEAARASPRRRMNHNFHTGPEDNPHRFLNVLLRHTYIRPHRHFNPPKAEMFVVLEGHVRIWCFAETGNVTAEYLLGRGESSVPWGIDLKPGVWHTVTAVSDHAVCLEVKPGPWNPATDKEFAAWAPAEGDPRAVEFLQRLLEGSNNAA